MMYFTFLSSLKLFSHKSHVEYSAHWIQRLASVTGVEVAIDSAAAISKVAISNGHCSWNEKCVKQFA